MGGLELVVGRCWSPTACHADPGWQAGSQSSHPFPHCLTVLVLHLAQQPGLTDGGFLKSGRVIYLGGGLLDSHKYVVFVAFVAFVGHFCSIRRGADNIFWGQPTKVGTRKNIFILHLCILCFITFLAIYQGKFSFGQF